MKKTFCGMMVILMVSLGLFISCMKIGQSASKANEASATGAKSQEEAKVQEPIILEDYADFQFTPGWNVPGTLFQADFEWRNQNGQRVSLRRVGDNSSMVFLNEVEKRFDFALFDLVTVVFKVKSELNSKINNIDYVSIEKK